MRIIRRLVRQAFGDVRLGFYSLAALCAKVRPSPRVAGSLGLPPAIIDYDGHALRRFAFERDNFSAAGQICSASRFNHFPDFWNICVLRFLVDNLNLRDDIGFWRGLRVKPLDGCSADDSAGDESDSDLEIRFHAVLP